jgi:hypothetical protein
MEQGAQAVTKVGSPNAMPHAWPRARARNAPHRQRFPLMNSRISSSEPARPSSRRATADMICPGVQ